MITVLYYKKVGKKEYTEYFKVVFTQEELAEAISICPEDLKYKVINK